MPQPGSEILRWRGNLGTNSTNIDGLRLFLIIPGYSTTLFGIESFLMGLVVGCLVKVSYEGLKSKSGGGYLP